MHLILLAGRFHPFCRGLDNRVYYMLAPQGQYYNYSGCGNTFNCNHPQVRQFVLDSLRYWVLEMHIDGFRFDLASIMTRAPSHWKDTQSKRGSESKSPRSRAGSQGEVAVSAGEHLPIVENSSYGLCWFQINCVILFLLTIVV